MDSTMKKVNDVVAKIVETHGGEDRVSIVNVYVPNTNNFFVCHENLLNKNIRTFQIDMFHSDDGFETEKDFGMSRDFGGWLNLSNRMGYVSFTANESRAKIRLGMIRVAESFYGRGYGTLLMNYFKELVKKNPLVNGGTKYTHIEGAFLPSWDRGADAVRNFYLRHGANAMMLDRKDEIRISLVDQNKSEKQ